MSYTTWRSGDDQILIDFVRNHEVFYNSKCKNYRNTKLKLNLWRQIGEVLNKSDSDCSKRWSYIRDYYIRRKAKPGTGGETASRRADLLSFLDNLPSFQRSSTNVDENPGSSGIMENSQDIYKQTENPAIECIKIEMTHDTSEETQSTQETEYSMSYNTDSKKDSNAKKRKNATPQEYLHRQNANQSSSQNLDETDLFFSSMAKIVKRLPRFVQAQLRMQIGTLVGNAELLHVSKNSPQSSAISPTSSTNNSDYYDNIDHCDDVKYPYDH